MATFYWVGGSGNWNDPLNWSEVSGGIANTGLIPSSSSDDVIFDENSGSGAYNVNITGSDLRVRDISVSETPTTYPQFAINSRLSIYGDMTFGEFSPQTAVTSGSSDWYFISDSANQGGKVINTKGVDLRRVSLDAAGYTTTFSLASPLTVSTSGGYLRLFNNSTTFTTNDFDITVSDFQNTSGDVTINLGSSNVTILTRLFLTDAGSTINAGTSTITFASTSGTDVYLYGNKTLYNVVFQSRTSSIQFITGSTSYTTTFNNLTINGPATAQEYVFVFNDSSIVINGVFTIATGVAGASRVNVWSSISIINDGRSTGQRTITVNGSTNITDATFSNINFQGTATPVSGTRIGDLGNNTNLTASSPKTVYRSASGSLPWNDDVWSNSSGGTPSRIHYPLPQDTAIIDDNSGSGVSTTTGVIVLPGINGLSRTTSYSFTINSSIRFIEDLLTGPNVGLLGGNDLQFTNKTSSIIDINAVAASAQHWNLYLATTTATLRLVGDLDLGSSGDLLIYDGDIITNGYNVNADSFSELGGIAAADVNIENSSIFVNQFRVQGGSSSLSSANSYIEIRGITGQIDVNENRIGQIAFNDVTFTSDNNQSLWKSIIGRDIVFNTLTIEPPTSDAEIELRISNSSNPCTIEVENLYIGGTANNAIRRVSLTRAQNTTDGRIYSVPTEDSFTLIINNDYNLEDVDFLNVKVSALGLSPLTGTRLGDLGWNENIVFDSPKNVYWVGSGSNVPFHSDNWAASSGGVASQINFPLPQDTVIFDDAPATAGDSITLTQNLYFPDADFSSRTQALSILPGNSRDINIMGDFNLSDAVTNTSLSNGKYFIFSGTNTTQNVRTRNLPFHNVSINGANTDVVLLDDLNISFYSGSSSSLNKLVISNGSFSPGSNDVNIGSVATSAAINSNAESNEAILNFGSGTWSLSASSFSSPIVFSNADFGRIAINPDTATIKLTGGNTSSSGSSIFTRGADLPKIEFAANNWWRFYTQGDYGTTTFADFTNSSLAPKIIFDSADGDAFFDAFNINGGGINSQAQLYGSSNNNWTYNGSGFVSVDAVFVNGTSVFPRNNWVAGVNSTDAGSNTGWVFLQRPDPTYFVDGGFEESTFEKKYVKYDEAKLKPFTDTSGVLYGWGSNGSGGLISGAVGDGFSSNNGTQSRSSPVEVLGNYDWKCVVGNGVNTFGIQNDGTLWSWGANFSGALGVNDISTCYSSPVPVCGGNTWYTASGTGSTTAAIDTNYKMWTWGWNQCGALGIDTTSVTDRTTPGRICDVDSDWNAVTSGRESHFGIKTDGTLWSWGRNGYGVLGVDSCIAYSSPVQEITSSSNWCHVCVNSDHVAGAIKKDGSLWTWGCAFGGALGHNLSTFCHRSSPGEISGGGNFWCTVAMGFSHGAAIKTNGTLWSWGQNDFGQLALQTLTNTSVWYSSPVQEVGEEIQWNKVEAATRQTSAIKSDGTLWSWGSGFLGTHGNDTNLDYSSPVQEITSSTSWKQISRGGNVIHGIQYD